MPPAKDYSNSRVYKIVCKDEFVTECYVGSTCNLYRRAIQHKHTCNNSNSEHHNFPLYKFIRDHGGWDNWVVVEVESVSCETVKQLWARERYWFEQLGATLNEIVPNRSKAEWMEVNREIVREKKIAYRQEHREEKLERDRAYHHKNKERLNAEKRKYYKTKQEHLKKYANEYYHKNKEAINAEKREKITCVCGTVVRRNGLPRHERSGQHKEWLEQQGALGEN